MAMSEIHVNVVAVVVSFNRRELLLESLAAILQQTVEPSRVVVIDNASTDGSADEVRRRYPDVEVHALSRNVGGAGGFAVGMAHAMTARPSWIWVMDDDTIPTPTALQELVDAAQRVPGAVVAGSRVLWTDGSDHPMNTPREKPLVSVRERDAALEVGALAVRSSSFVSMLVSGEAVRDLGLPIADYFIWNDDFEYSTRLLRHGRGIFVPSSVVIHKTRVLGSTDADPGARFYYEVRNKLWLFFRSSGLSAGEKLLYGGSTLLRWVKTFAGSRDRRVLRDGLVRGFRDGISAPRSNGEVLRDLGASSDAVRSVEAAGRG